MEKWLFNRELLRRNIQICLITAGHPVTSVQFASGQAWNECVTLTSELVLDPETPQPLRDLLKLCQVMYRGRWFGRQSGITQMFIVGFLATGIDYPKSSYDDLLEMLKQRRVEGLDSYLVEAGYLESTITQLNIHDSIPMPSIKSPTATNSSLPNNASDAEVEAWFNSRPKTNVWPTGKDFVLTDDESAIEIDASARKSHGIHTKMGGFQIKNLVQRGQPPIAIIVYNSAIGLCHDEDGFEYYLDVAKDVPRSTVFIGERLGHSLDQKLNPNSNLVNVGQMDQQDAAEWLRHLNIVDQRKQGLLDR